MLYNERRCSSQVFSFLLAQQLAGPSASVESDVQPMDLREDGDDWMLEHPPVEIIERPMSDFVRAHVR